MSRIKLKQKDGAFIVTLKDKNDREERYLIFPTMHDALEYVFYRRFMALVAGEPIGYHNDTLYPVYSLLPPTVEKTVKFYDLDAQGGVIC